MKLVTPIMPSMTTKCVCDCGETSRKFALIEIDLHFLAVSGIKDLEFALNEKFICHKSNRICHTSKSNQFITNTFSDIIFFDIEPLREQQKPLVFPDQ